MTTRVLIAAVLITALSCNFLTQSVPGGGTPGAGVTPDLHPTSFTAQPTSGVSVQLAWPAADGAEKYLLDVKAGDGDFLPLAELAADQTSFEDVGVPDDFELVYRLRVQTASGTSDGETVTVTTPKAMPDPLTVQANDYKPITWSPPTPDPKHPITDPSKLLPPGFDLEHPEDMDPSTLMTHVAASAEIGPKGGSVTVTTPDKITYELTIPAGALDDQTTITLTPIESIDGLPFSAGLQGAVRIEPGGLPLKLPATLTITRADAAAPPAGTYNLPFTFEEDGSEFQLYPFAPAEASALNPGTAHTASQAPAPHPAGPLEKIALDRLKDFGVAPATKEEARKVVKAQPTAAEDQLLNALAYDQDVEPELMPLAYKQQLAAAKLLSIATNDALDWGQMVTSLSELEILLKYYGKDKANQDRYEKIWEALLDRLHALLQHNKEKCLTSDDFSAQAVVAKMTRAPKGSFGEQMATRFKKKFGDSALKDAAAMTKLCVLNLEIRSEIKADQPGLVEYIVRVSGTIQSLKINYGRSKIFLTGKGELSYGPVEVIPHTEGLKDVKCEPWDPQNSISAAVTITNLEPVFFPNGTLSDLILMPMTVKDLAPLKFTATCTYTAEDGTTQTFTKKINIAGGSAWGGFFVAAHLPDLAIDGWVHPKPGGSEVNGSNQSIIAGWLSERPSFHPMGATLSDWSESSEFKLVDAAPK